MYPTLKPQENSLAADKQLWKPTLCFVPGHEQHKGPLTGFSSTQAGLLQWQEAFVSISRFLGWILGVEPCAHSILSSHTSLPLDSDPPCQEQNPGNVSYAELRLGDTCSDNQHRATPPTFGPRLSRCIRPHPDRGCLHIHTQCCQPRPLPGGKPLQLLRTLFPCMMPAITSFKIVWASLPHKARA